MHFVVAGRFYSLFMAVVVAACVCWSFLLCVVARSHSSKRNNDKANDDDVNDMNKQTKTTK